MKFLGWIPWKVKQHSIDALKNITLVPGNSCCCLSAKPMIDEQQCYHHPIMSQISPNEIKLKGDEEIAEEEESSPDFFHGFLAIGTLGSQPITTEPTTPKFSISLENVIKKETGVTDKELNLINYELDKFFEAEAEEEGNESSGRSSYASIITLSSKQIEATDAEEHEKSVECPLQGYLFGSMVELSETRVVLRKEKTSLGELFNNEKLSSEHQMGDKGNKQFSKGTYGMDFVKKMSKKLRFVSKSSKGSIVGDDSGDTVPNKKKFLKVLKMFHKKIHPEKSPAENKFTKSQKYTINNYYESGYSKGDLKFKDSTGTGEYWIKTDADYVVLEL